MKDIPWDGTFLPTSSFESFPSLNHEDVVSFLGLHLGVLWICCRARLERESGFFEFFYQGAADFPAQIAT